MGRPRQNVIFEFGLLLSKMGEDHVTVFHKGPYGSVELPSDLGGVRVQTFSENLLDTCVKPIYDTLNRSGIRIKKI